MMPCMYIYLYIYIFLYMHMFMISICIRTCLPRVVMGRELDVCAYVYVIHMYTYMFKSHHNTLRHTATHYNTLQHTATHCNTLQHTGAHSGLKSSLFLPIDNFGDYGVASISRLLQKKNHHCLTHDSCPTPHALVKNVTRLMYFCDMTYSPM